MAATMVSTHYAPQQNLHYGYVPPPSPPMDDTARCSLPSISNLLGLADQGSPTSETSPQNRAEQQCMEFDGVEMRHSALTSSSAQTCKPDTRPSSSHFSHPALLRTALPPSPPMSSDASFEGYNSPSTRSVSQISNGPAGQYFFETAPPLSQMDASAQPISAPAPRVSVQPSTYQSQFAAPSYISQPSMPAYYPSSIQAAAPAPPPMSSLYFQRPLPQVSS